VFEFHGWINIQCVDDEETLEDTYFRQSQLCKEIQEKVEEIEWCNGIFNLIRGVNGDDYLSINGCANHYQPSIINFLFWLADRRSDSYGIIHILDHDKIASKDDYGVKIWRLIKGEVLEFTDPIMTPGIKGFLV
jgi:hypothetical protein